MKRIFYAAVMAISGCATNYAGAPPEKITAAIRVKDSPYDTAVTYQAPAIQLSGGGIIADGVSVYLRSFEDKKSKSMLHQAVVAVTYSGEWRFYETTSFPGGETVIPTAVDRSLDRCSASSCLYTETVIVSLQPGQLVGGSSSGLKFRLNAQRSVGTEIFIPANYVRGFLARLAPAPV